MEKHGQDSGPKMMLSGRLVMICIFDWCLYRPRFPMCVCGHAIAILHTCIIAFSEFMREWLNAYHESRPGLKILHQRIDDFITDYEAQEEMASKEREAQAAEGGWTVVSHHKGRKKTTDSESGIAVGSVAQAAVINNMTKKKNKEIPLDFYRFQKRDARRSEFMMLQSKFEEDKKRIQQLRAARKFCPY